MLYKFKRVENSLIQTFYTKKFVPVRRLVELLKKGHDVVLVDEKTNEDVLPKFMRTNGLGLSGSWTAPQPKMNKCSICGEMTANRYKCRACWDRVDTYEGW